VKWKASNGNKQLIVEAYVVFYIYAEGDLICTGAMICK
jgi:hypothetical protein